MSVFLARSPAGGWSNPNLSQDLDAFAGIVGWPAGQSGCPRAAVSSRAGSLPVGSYSPSRAGFTARSWTDDYYHRIHITPREIAMGNIASAQSVEVSVWNATFDDLSLSTVEGAGEGIEAIAPGPFPLLFRALRELAWTIRITSDGPSTADITLRWMFAGLEPVGVRITATRIIAWPFVPDWSEGVTERLAWASDMLRSDSAVEQRRALRLAPRRSFEAQILVSDQERTLLDLMIGAWGARIWALPIWHDIQQLTQRIDAGATKIPCQTEGYDFVPDLAMLRSESAFLSEVMQVDAVSHDGLVLKHPVQRAWPAGSRLYPVRRAQLEAQPDLKRLTDTLWRGPVRFRIAEPCDWKAVPPGAQYRGRQVLLTPPEESEDLTTGYLRLLRELDNGSGLPVLTDTADRALQVQGYRWMLNGRTEAATQRGLLYWLRGRQRALWVPTFAADLTIVANMLAATSTLDVAMVGYAQFGVNLAGRRDIRIELVGGALLYRRIVAASVIDEHSERLQVDAPFDATIKVRQVLRISFMALMRADADEIELQHETDGDGITLCQLILRGVRDDEL